MREPRGRGWRGKATTPFFREEAVMSIYGRPIPHESQCKLRLTN
jgi:hypothetical protein